MSVQAAHFVFGEASGSPGGGEAGDEAVYTFTGALSGAGREFNFSLFGLVQGSGEASAGMRATARQLLHDIYLPLLPWDATERPNALDSIATVVNAQHESLTSMALAIVVDSRAYLGWHGDGRVCVITEEGVAHFDYGNESPEPVASCVLSPGAYLLLCSGGLWQNLSDDDVMRIVTRAAGVQAACDELVNQALHHDEASRPLVVLVHRPD
ncbi:MAG: hypothetical protein Kow00120_22140 [Anaerolineae bacterium]